MSIKSTPAPTGLKSGNLLAWRDKMYKLCPTPTKGELVATLFDEGQYYGYVCQKAAGYHSHWMRVCISNLEDVFEESKLSWVLDFEFKVKHATGKYVVFSFDSNRVRVYRSTPPLEDSSSDLVFSEGWNSWKRVDEKELIGVSEEMVEVYDVSIVNRCYLDTASVIYSGAWTDNGVPATIDQVARGEAYTLSGIPITSEGVYLGDGVYIDPEDVWF
ncbi:hypothetical protein [Vibrio harveyi]